MPKLTLVPPGPRARRRPEPLLRDVVGAVLRAERTAQGRTLADVAAVAGVSLPHLSEVERGRKEPSSEVLAAVCGALDLPLADLLRRSLLDVASLTSTAGSTAGSARSGGVRLSIAA